MKTINNEGRGRGMREEKKKKYRPLKINYFIPLCIALIRDFHFVSVNSNTSRTQTESRTD